MVNVIFHSRAHWSLTLRTCIDFHQLHGCIAHDATSLLDSWTDHSFANSFRSMFNERN